MTDTPSAPLAPETLKTAAGFTPADEPTPAERQLDYARRKITKLGQETTARRDAVTRSEAELQDAVRNRDYWQGVVDRERVHQVDMVRCRCGQVEVERDPNDTERFMVFHPDGSNHSIKGCVKDGGETLAPDSAVHLVDSVQEVDTRGDEDRVPAPVPHAYVDNGAGRCVLPCLLSIDNPIHLTPELDPFHPCACGAKNLTIDGVIYATVEADDGSTHTTKHCSIKGARTDEPAVNVTWTTPDGKSGGWTTTESGEHKDVVVNEQLPTREDLISLYGTCPVCFEPRTIEESQEEDGSVTRALVCTAADHVEEPVKDELHFAAGACEPDYHRAMPSGDRCRCGKIDNRPARCACGKYELGSIATDKDIAAGAFHAKTECLAAGEAGAPGKINLKLSRDRHGAKGSLKDMPLPERERRLQEAREERRRKSVEAYSTWDKGGGLVDQLLTSQRMGMGETCPVCGASMIGKPAAFGCQGRHSQQQLDDWKARVAAEAFEDNMGAHNPWSRGCGRRVDGEPTRDGAVCRTCEPMAWATWHGEQTKVQTCSTCLSPDHLQEHHHLLPPELFQVWPDPRHLTTTNLVTAAADARELAKAAMRHAETTRAVELEKLATSYDAEWNLRKRDYEQPKAEPQPFAQQLLSHTQGLHDGRADSDCPACKLFGSKEADVITDVVTDVVSSVATRLTDFFKGL